ncbi:MFS transporter [Gryllotalpicola protaetiae]|uniref:MFS transporter n=1 Tax=Gryllotalpicola protaetiae TaxID=2419771 RepID=UPI001C65E99E|nr:MFS transporter [Gryllotalpicola protaetiae]
MTLSVLTIGLDTTVLSVALPTLAGALHASESELQWFTSGYALALTAAMLPAGLLGDRFGRKRVLVIALALFVAGSAACAFAPGPGLFLAARLALGLAGAGITVMAVSALTVLFSEQERPRAIAVWAGANFLALPLGPILGGWLLSHFWWGWVFLINVPVALIGLVATVILIPESRAPERPGLDATGIVASSAGLVAVTYGVIDAGQHGWGTPAALGWIAAGILTLIAFFLWESRLASRPEASPLLDPALFRSASFTWGATLAAVTLLSMSGILFTMPQYFQAVLGETAMSSGLRLLPLIGGMVVGLVPSGRLAAAIGAKLTVTAGFALIAAGMLLGTTTTRASSVLLVSAWMALVGVGTGLAISTAASAALSDLPTDRSGVGSAAMQAIQKLGAPFGAAIVGSVLLTGYQARLNEVALPAAAAGAARQSVFAGLTAAQRLGSPALETAIQNAFLHGLTASLLASAGISVFGAIATLIFLPGRREPARRAEFSSRVG